MLKSSIKSYYRITKPGIIYANVLTAIAGFFLAARGHLYPELFFAMLFGTSFTIASACIFNNVIDLKIDAKMERTKNRPLVTKSISVKYALIYASLLGILGIGLLTFTNMLTVLIGLIGFIDYVFLYTYSKRITPIATLIGSISGAAPIVAGYTAVTNHFDLGALLLFLIMTFWQMPHFYAIAIYRLKDYQAANIPVLPSVKGIFATKIHIVLYGVAFLVAACLLTFFGYTGYLYLIGVFLTGAIWLGISLRGFWLKDSTAWARRVFFFSLITVLLLSVLLSINAYVF